MGGCAVSCLACCNSMQQSENKAMKAVASIPSQSVEVGDAPENVGECRVRRSPSMSKGTLQDMKFEYYGGALGSLPRYLAQTVKKYGGNKAIAWRPIDKTEKCPLLDEKGHEVIDQKTGKVKLWEYTFLKETQYLSYKDWWAKVLAFGAGLVKLGVRSGSKVGIYEETRGEWMTSAYGLWSQNMVGVTVYANLGESALGYAVKESELSVVVCNAKGVPTLMKLCKKIGVPCPRMIYVDPLPVDLDISGVDVHRWEDVVALGEKAIEADPKIATPEQLPSEPDDLALVMYTSGTTGDPKGVMITHGNLVSCVLALAKRMEEFLGTEENESYVCYLPLAHILEFAAENVMLLRGAMLGYGNPRTLVDSSAKPHGDLREFRPTFFAGVPRIFDTIRKTVEGRLPPKGSFARRSFDRAFADRKVALSKGLETPFYNKNIFNKPQAILGGRCKALISGGAPMSDQTQEWLTVIFGCSVGQGYGLTETCACCSIQRYYDYQFENIGGLLSNSEVKLRDALDWKSTNVPPQGEICIRGPSVTKGYYKQEEKTKEAFDPNGWFYTGDVGQFNPDGTLKIIGRVKALAKNSHGEYIAMEALESTYVLNELVLPNGVCILVDSHQPYICALALTDENKAMKFATENGIAGSYPDILKKPEFQKKAALSLAATAQGAGKRPFELVKNVRILSDEWTPENDVMTAASKLKRRVIDVRYAEVIKELFAE